MATLRRKHDERTCTLEPEYLVGRGRQCALRLEAGYISAQHALLRWNGSAWELLDRGSHNGTALNGQLIEPGRAYPLAVNDTIAFGHADEQWLLVDVSEPQPMVVDVGTGRAIAGINGVIGVPSAEDPRSTVYRDVDGHFKLEHSDEPLRTLFDGDRFELDGRFFRFVRPNAVGTTQTADQTMPPSGEPLLVFSVSSDEEFVALGVQVGERRVDLGARSHNYLLLTLARARLADIAPAVPESARGWMYKEDLADALKVSAPQIDGEVFRIRHHFGVHGLAEAATIIERRPRTRQLRIGIRNFRIERV